MSAAEIAYVVRRYHRGWLNILLTNVWHAGSLALCKRYETRLAEILTCSACGSLPVGYTCLEHRP